MKFSDRFKRILNKMFLRQLSDHMQQDAIFIEGTTSAVFLEFNIPSETDIAALKKALLGIYESKTDELFILFSLSKSAYGKFGNTAPERLMDFQTLKGINGLQMPSTQSDLFIWAHGFSKSAIFDFILNCKNSLSSLLTLELEQEGFRYHDSRDIMGFVDGSANPKGIKRKPEAIVADDADHAGGSFVLIQQWDHDLTGFHSHSVQEQERVIGRTKEDSIELEGDEMPNNSHVSRTDLKVNGEALKIYRRSFPFANKENKGLFFLAFSKSIDRFDHQLKSMLGLSKEGISDRIMDFSVAKTGSYYFAPSNDELLKILTSN